MTKPNVLILLVTILPLILPLVCFSKDFGKKGHTYEIKEQAFLEMKDERLKGLDMKKHEEEMKARTSLLGHLNRC